VGRGLQDVGVTLGGHVGRGKRDLGATYGSRIVVLMAGVLSQSVLAWNLGADGRGSYAVCLVFGTSLAKVFSVGIDNSMTYLVSSQRLSVAEGFSCALLLGAIYSMVAGSVGWLLLDLPVRFFSQASQEAFLLSLLLIPMIVFAEVFLRLLTAVRQFRSFAAINLFRGVCQLLLAVFLVWWLGLGVIGALLAFIITGLLAVLLCLVVLRRTCRLAWVSPSRSQLKEVLSHGIRQYIPKIGSLVNTQTGTVFLAFVATKTEIGWFALASRITVLVLMFPHSLNTVLLPRIAADEHGRKDLVARAMRVSFAVCGATFLFLALFGTVVVTIVFSSEFLPAVKLIRILAIGGTCYSVGNIALTYLIGIGCPGRGAAAVTAGIVLNLMALFLLTPTIGVSGAAWAMTANYVFSSVVLMWLFLRSSNLRLQEVVRFSRADWC